MQRCLVGLEQCARFAWLPFDTAFALVCLQAACPFLTSVIHVGVSPSQSYPCTRGRRLPLEWRTYSDECIFVSSNILLPMRDLQARGPYDKQCRSIPALEAHYQNTTARGQTAFDSLTPSDWIKYSLSGSVHLGHSSGERCHHTAASANSLPRHSDATKTAPCTKWSWRHCTRPPSSAPFPTQSRPCRKKCTMLSPCKAKQTFRSRRAYAVCCNFRGGAETETFSTTAAGGRVRQIIISNIVGWTFSACPLRHEA